MLIGTGGGDAMATSNKPVTATASHFPTMNEEQITRLIRLAVYTALFAYSCFMAAGALAAR